MTKTINAARRFIALALLAASSAAFGLTCDVNGDGVIDLTDINLITAARNQLASGPSDPRDADGDGKITVSDVRICSQRCTRAACSTVNLPPTANAGPDQTVVLNATVTLNGAASTDPEGGALTYLWTFTQRPPGSTATLSVIDPVHPTFVVDKAGTYIVQLVVKDPLNAASSPDTVQISTLNSRPIANAGPDQTALVGQTVVLDGHLSSDADGDPLTYAWSFTAKPAGSAATLNVTDPVHPTFVVDKPGSYTARLVVNDGFVNSLPDDVVITTTNSPPVARAGPNQTRLVGDTAVLDGSGSSDADGDPLTYAWSLTLKPPGSAAVLSNAGVVNPSFVVDKAGTYVAQLIVNDGHVNSLPSTVTISTTNTPPVANAGPDQAGLIGQLIHLTGAASSDVDGDPLTFLWSFTLRPPGSAAALSATNIVNPTFTIDVAGTYVAQLIVNDGHVNSLPDSVQISTTNQPPVANAGPDQTVPLGSTVLLSGSLSSDPENSPLTYAWSIQSKPIGSTATLSATNIVNPTFVADKAGHYVVQLIVNDGSLNSAAAQVQIDTANSRPVANAGPPQTVNAGAATTVLLDGSGSFDPDGAAVVLTYSWSFTAFPGATPPTFSPNANVVNPSFVANKVGTYVAQLIVSDGLLFSSPSTVTITANNTAPVANNDSYSTAQDTLLLVGAPGVLGNDSDAQGDPLTANLVGNVTHGTLTLNANGGFTYTPATSYNGPDSFTYRANDGTVNSNTATASISVNSPTTADIQVTNVVSNATPTVGQNVTFTVTAKNLGPALATGVQITDLLPAGYGSVAIGGATQGSYIIGTGVWTVGTLAVNATATLTVTGTVLAAGPYNSTATRTGSTPTDPNAANDSATATVTPVTGADIAVTNVVSNATPSVGQTVTFTVTAKNLGPGVATVVQITDLLPAGYGSVAIGGATQGSYIIGTGVWTVGTLAVNATATLTVTGTVLAAGPYNSTATRTGSTPTDPNAANDSATATVTPVTGADIAVTNVVSNATPSVGQSVTFTVTATNLGPGIATGVQITDLLPAGYTFAGAGATLGSYNSISGIWNMPTMAVSQTGTLTLNGTVLASGPYNSTATRTASTPTDPNPANDSATATVTPVTGADIAVTNVVSNATPSVGQSVTFTVTATNLGPGVATTVQITDLLPAGYTFAGSGTTLGSYNSISGIWNMPTMAVSQTGTLTLNGTVLASGPYNSTATRTASTPTDPNPANDSATATVTPVTGADIAVTNVVSNATPSVGQSVTFTVTATNLGPGVATTVQITDLLPAGYTFAGAGATLGSYNSISGIWNMPTMAVSQTGTLTLNGTVLATGPYNSTATRTASTPTDPNPANDSATATVTPVTSADIAVTNVVSNATPSVGQSVTFTVTATNLGPGVATTVQITDLLPAGYTFAGAGATLGSYNSISGIWNMPTMAVSQTGTLTLNGTVLATGPYNSTATRTASTPTDPNPANDSATATVTPVTSADIAVTNVVSNATPSVGQTVQFTVTATNLGPGIATGVQITDLLPAGYTFAGGGATLGSYNSISGIWNIPTMTVSQSGTLTLNGTVLASGPYNSTATRTASTPTDPNPANDSATATVTPVTSADIAVTNVVNNATPSVGQTVQFTVTAKNLGPGIATGVQITDLLPAGYTFAGGGATLGSYNSISGIWNIPTMTVSQSGTLTLNGTVLASGPYNSTATRTASTPTDPNPANDSATATVTIGAPITVTVPLIPLGGTGSGTVTLPSAAPVGGVTVSLSSATTSVATVPASIGIAAGATSGTFTINGVSLGSSLLTASASGFTNGTATVTVTNNVISIGSITLGPSASGNVPVTLSQPAPAGGLLVSLVSSNPSVLSFASPTVTIPAGATIAPSNPIVNATSTLGTVTLTASGPGYVSGTGTGRVVLTATLTPNPLNTVAGRSDLMTVTLSAPALAGGVAINLASSNTAVATVPASITVPAGNVSTTFSVTGVSTGSGVTITASGALIANATATVNVAPAPTMTYNFPNYQMGKDSKEDSFSVGLSAPAPAGGVVVHLVSSDPSRLLLAPNSSLAVGTGTLDVTVPAGSSSAAWSMQALVGDATLPTATITVTAPGYTGTSGTHPLTPSGFFVTTASFATTSASPDTAIDVCFVKLDAALMNNGFRIMRPGVTPVSITMNSSNTGIGTITGSPQTMSGGQQCTNADGNDFGFHPAGGTGPATLSLATPSGYSTPANLNQSIVATVSNPSLSYGFPNYAMGKNSKEDSFSVTLSAPAPVGGLVVHLVSSDATRLLLAPNGSLAVGTGTLDVTVAAGGTSAAWSMQALAGDATQPTATITVTAPGYVGTSGTHPLTPSGFFVATASFATTTLSPDTAVDVCFVKLDAANMNNGFRVLRPGVTPVSITMTSSNTGIGTITGSPQTMSAGQQCTNADGNDFGFHPAGGTGPTTLSLATPAGYSTPANLNQSITATVSGPSITYNFPNYPMGKDSKEDSFSVALSAPAPAGGLVVHLVSSDPTKLLLAPNGSTVVGTGTLDVTVPAGSSGASWSMQALVGDASQPTATITVTAPGYGGTSGTHPLTPAGFFISTANITTTTLSPNTAVDVCFVKLDASNNNSGFRVLRPGVSVNVAMSSGNISVGTIVASPKTVAAGQTCTSSSGGAFAFHPVGTGSATLTLATPSGYSTPANLNTSITAGVSVPGINFLSPNYAMGKDSQENFGVTLDAPAPAGGVNLTLTSLDPSRLLFAPNSATTVGTGTLVINIPAGNTSAAFSLQALADNGSVGVTANAPGFTTGNNTHPLTPSGFFINTPGNFSTTVASANTAVDVCFVKLDNALNNGGFRVLRPGVSVNVALNSSNTAAGTIVASPKSVNAGQTCTSTSGGDFAFHPVAVGTTTLTLPTPSGYSTPFNLNTAITATVN